MFRVMPVFGTEAKLYSSIEDYVQQNRNTISDWNLTNTSGTMIISQSDFLSGTSRASSTDNAQKARRSNTTNCFSLSHHRRHIASGWP